MRINKKRIGPGRDTYIVAEMSANHKQELSRALRLVDEAKVAGADAIKTQAYLPDSLTLPIRNKYFDVLKGTIWEGRSLYELYSDSYMPRSWHKKIQKRANDLEMDFFSTSFSSEDVDFLEGLEVPIHKIASFELVDIPLIKKVASTGKPLILSTGMATLKEISSAIKAAREEGAKEIALLKCTSGYPARPEEMNLATIPDMMSKFRVPVGLSDHTLDISVPVAAMTLGACIIEKHFTISRAEGGPDSKFSLEPEEFKNMIDAIRISEKAIGKISYRIGKDEKKSRMFRRSLFVVKDVAKGDVFSDQNVRSVRPSYGLSPIEYSKVIGRRAAKNVKAGTPLSWLHIEDGMAHKKL
ncbi:MAG: pseudaminic acid synthase [Candidatus Bathyarchaeota archaeon]|nr:pseudaminic acid synthase [Candidatus Bathyarchaeota archaeon]